MSGYEVEHGIKAQQQDQPRRRPDLTTFFATLDHVDTSGSRQPQNSHALPMPRDISAAFRNLANAYDMMRVPADGNTSGALDDHGPLLNRLIQDLMQEAENPPSEVQGVSDEFVAQLERVPKKVLKDDMSCPICGNPFLEDSHPLVVRLPCHKDHIFDLECITPWLKLNPTCPMDRQELVKKKAPPPPVNVDEEDGEYDDMFG